MVGVLPSDFLTIRSSAMPSGRDLSDGNPRTDKQIQEQLDEQAAIALHQQLNAASAGRNAYPPPTNIRGRLLISVMQVNLIQFIDVFLLKRNVFFSFW
jgi:hypothetical protein